MNLDVTTIVRTVMRVATIGGPILVGCAFFVILRPLVAGKGGRWRFKLAIRGVEPMSSRWRQLVAGTLVPVVGLVALNVSFAIEEEIREGPERAIEGLVAATHGEASWVLQAGTQHFMNDSRIPNGSADTLIQLAADSGIAAGAFEAVFSQIQIKGRVVTSHIFSAPEGSPLLPNLQSCIREDCRIGERGVIADAGEGIPVGSTVSIRGHTFDVVAHSTAPRSLLNRAVFYVTPEGFRRFDAPNETRYGVVIAADRSVTEALVAEAGLSDSTDVQTTADLLEANRTFWTGGGTPLVLILISMVGILGGASLYAARREEQEHHRELLGTMWALGLTRPATIEIDLIRAVTKVLLGALAAIPIAWLIVQAMNAAVLGFNAVMRPAHVFASAGVFLLAAGSGVAVMAWRLRQATPIYMLTS